MLNRILLAACVFFLTSIAQAGEPTCHSHNSVNYCTYTGSVSKIYANTHGIILMYFDTVLPIEKSNISITNGAAAAYPVADNPEFANLFYSTALAAQASGRNITIQMRGTESGYLKFDRIWLAE